MALDRLAYLSARAAIARQIAERLLVAGNDTKCAHTALVAVQAATEGAGMLPAGHPRRRTFEQQALEAAQLAFHCTRENQSALG